MTDKLSILHTESSLGWGGQEIRVLAEAKGVAARGHDVLLCAPDESRIAKEAAAYGVDVHLAPIGRKSVGGVAGLRKLLGLRTFDVVNTHSSTDSWLVALACATRSRAPHVIRTRHISASIPRNIATGWLYRRSAERVVTTGEKLRLQVIEESGVDPARVVSIPTGIDLERFRPGDRRLAREALGLARDEILVGIVATLRSWKGHRYLLRAFAGLARRDARLLVIGDGPQREALEKESVDLGLGERVRFMGNQRDVAPWLQSLDLFCLPSYANEGVPQALMQAMACALPVVTTPVGSILEIVEDGVSGVIVPPENVDALRDALAALLADEERRSLLGSRAASVAQARFGEGLMVDRMLAVFHEVAHRG